MDSELFIIKDREKVFSLKMNEHVILTMKGNNGDDNENNDDPCDEEEAPV